MTDLALLLLIALVIVVLWQGPKALPRLGAAAGDAIRNARRAVDRGDADTQPTDRAHGEDRPPRT